MRAELFRSLGVEWGPVTNGIAELVAVPQEVREHFSVRHAEIMEGEHELRQALRRVRAITASDYTARLRARATQMLGPGGLTRQSSTFTRREVIQQLAVAHPEGAPPGHLERLADDFLARTCVVLTRAGDDTDLRHRETLYTTPDMLRVGPPTPPARAGSFT